nr:uncharacterized protein LOC124816358 [Hydra vulgaris]
MSSLKITDNTSISIILYPDSRVEVSTTSICRIFECDAGIFTILSEPSFFYFHHSDSESQDRKDEESVSGYITELPRLSEHCEFGENLNDYLRDRFVCGLNNENVQQKLLTIKNLTLEITLDTARAYETAYKDTKAILTKESFIEQDELHKVEIRTKSEEKKGCTAETEENKDDFLALYSISEESDKVTGPVMVNVKINGSEVSMEVDTGAAVSVMGISTYKRIKKNEGKLQNSGVILKTYTGELIRPEGIGLVEVVYNGQCCKLPITVVDSRVKTLVEKYPEVFSDCLGCLKNFQCHIPLCEGAEPKFYKARPVPYALRTRIEKEFDPLEDQGVWRKVQYSKWAAPIVPVLKNSKDSTGPLRICGDYKITVNQAAPVDSYPIPNITDQLATIAKGERYTKLDLSQAYQQLELDEISQEFLTIDTHQGLYQLTRLQFGVHSATGIFQREMDRRLGRLSFVKVRVDDILISGKTDAEHLNNLESV